jgi:hypothetical protein
MESASYGGLSYIQPLTVPVAVDFISPTQINLCIHFWEIASPNGPVSLGTCKLCGDKKEFRNSVYSSTWSRGALKHEGPI